MRFRHEDDSIGSPGCTSRTDRSKAERWATEQLGAGRLDPNRHAAGSQKTAGVPAFREWSADWWTWDRCPYIKGKRARGYSISRHCVDARRSYLTHYLLPRFGDLRLEQITPATIERWLLDLPDVGLPQRLRTGIRVVSIPARVKVFPRS